MFVPVEEVGGSSVCARQAGAEVGRASRGRHAGDCGRCSHPQGIGRWRTPATLRRQ